MIELCIYGVYIILERECGILDFFLKRQRNHIYNTIWCFIQYWFIQYHCSRGLWDLKIMKSFYKAGFKFLSNIFVVKERELEIGSPTNVKHVAHIGWDGQSGSAPSWMSSFSTGPDFAATSIGNTGSALSPWSSQDFGECFGRQTTDDLYKDVAPPDLPNIPKSKLKRKKSKSTSSQMSGSCSSRSSRSSKTKAKFVEDNNPKPNMNIQVV